METRALQHQPRHLAVDDRGIGLRATWRPEHGFVNLSLWRADRCVETFHLTPDEVSSFVAFLVEALAESVPRPSTPPLAVVPEALPTRPERSVRRVAGVLRRLVQRLRPPAAPGSTG